MQRRRAQMRILPQLIVMKHVEYQWFRLARHLNAKLLRPLGIRRLFTNRRAENLLPRRSSMHLQEAIGVILVLALDADTFKNDILNSIKQ